MNLHTFERQPTESVSDYRARRSLSAKACERMTMTGPHRAPARKQPNSREHFRANHDFSKRVRFADALMAHWAAKRAAVKN